MPRESKLGITTSQHKDKNAYQREWRKLNPGYDKEHRNPEKTRESAWMRRYGITRDDYNRMFSEQNGKCGICGTTKIGRNHTHFHVDHNHATGKVRGLLCDKCNRGLGYFNDNEFILIEAHNYLVKDRYESN
jgi:hypothetical protein